MNNETILTNARIVTTTEVFSGTIVLSDGVIKSISHGQSSVPSAEDFEGDLIIPGLIDIHTDNLEKHAEPRPGVKWPFTAALATHDQQLYSAGITTVLDSLSVGDFYEEDEKSGRNGTLQQAVSTLEEAQSAGLLHADHYLHVRCELSTSNVIESFLHFADDSFVKLVSVMDHTPGQRQWSNLEKWAQFNKKRFGNNDQARNEFLQHRLQMQEKYSEPNRIQLIEECKRRNLPLASHDDTTLEHVIEAHEVGIEISEFPTTIEAARKAHSRGMKNVMGAPNVVLGGSHSGNVAAIELAKEGLLHGLASDYVPISLLHGAFLLCEQSDMTLPQSIATVTKEPAEMIGLSDRGEIATNKRADLVRIKEWHHMPMIRGIWRNGQRF